MYVNLFFVYERERGRKRWRESRERFHVLVMKKKNEFTVYDSELFLFKGKFKEKQIII